MKPLITVCGSMNMDTVVCAPRIPGPGETLQGRSLSYVPGGKGANQAVAAARLGADVRFIGRIGNDPFGEPLRRNLADNGVDVTCVRETPETPTGVAVIWVDDAGENRIILAAGSNYAVSPEDVDASGGAFQGQPIVLLQNEIRMETTLHAARVAKEAGATVLWNPAPAPDQWPEEILGLVDIVVPNESEAERLTGVIIDSPQTLRQAALTLLDKGFQTVVLTLGEQGVVWVEEEREFEVPAFEVEVVDTTAAGDTFVGALAVGLGEGMHKRDAVRFACGAAALAVTKAGAQAGIPTRRELEDFLKERG